MTTEKRNDIHRPSAIDPSQYEFVGMEYIKGDDYDIGYSDRDAIKAHMAQTGGTYASHAHGGNCMVCGAHAIYTALFYHAPTNEYVRTGQDCAEKMDMACGDWNAFRSRVRNLIEAHAGKRKAQATLEAAGLSTCWTIFENPPQIDLQQPASPVADDVDVDAYWAAVRAFERAHNEERTITDIVLKLIRFGSISEAQTGFLHKLVARIAERPAREAKRAEEQAAAADCPTGRVDFEGVIVSIRVDEGQFGTVTKILVKHDSGFKLWGTRPSGTYNAATGMSADRGDRISFRATVTVSEKDSKFGFFSRPTGGKFVAAAAATEAA
jgi:hypothetical protein